MSRQASVHLPHFRADIHRGRLVGLLLAVVLAVGACTEADVEGEATTDVAFIDEGCASSAVLCVGLVLAPGELSTAAGVTGVVAAADARGGHHQIMVTNDAGEYRAALEDLSNQEFDLVFARSGVDIVSTERAVLGVATGSSSRFVYLGPRTTPAQNVASLIFDERRAGFLAGAAAGLVTETDVVGAVFATDLDPRMVRYKEGWEAGVRFSNPEALLLTTYHPGAFDISFDDPLWSVAAARAAVENGADVVFAAGGVSASAALVDVARLEGAVRCIGSEGDFWEVVPEARGCLLTSAIWEIDTRIEAVVSSYERGTSPAGVLFGDVSLTPIQDAGQEVDIVSHMEEIVTGLDNGSIRIG